jgi:hypothetical protein
MIQRNHNMHGTFLLNHVRPSSMKRVAYEVALKEKKQLAEGTVAFVFEKPNGFHFQAGQHIRMTLLHPPETDGEGTSTWRLRSIHDRIGGKSEGEELIDAQASDSSRPERERAGRIASDHQAPSQ